MATMTLDRIPVNGRAARTAARSTGALRLTRRGERVVAAVAVIVTVIAFYLVSLLVSNVVQASQSHDFADVATTTVTVSSGDTLWDIAVEVAPTADPRATIDRIEHLNALSTGSVLHVGQTLVVPVID